MSRSAAEQRNHQRSVRRKALSTRLTGFALGALLLATSSVVSAPALLRLPFVRLSAADVSLRPTHHAARDSAVRQMTHADLPAPPLLQGSATPGPSSLIEDDPESWRQAGPGPERVGKTLRSHQVRVDAQGRLSGRLRTFDRDAGELRPVADAEVLFLKTGQVVALGVSDDAGTFEIEGLTSGTHAVLVRSSAAVLAYSLHVLSDVDAVSPPEVPAAVGVLSLDSLAVPQEDTRAVLAWIDSTFVGSREPVRRLRELPTKRPAQPGPNRAAGTAFFHHQVRLQSDGRLIGRIRRLHPETGQTIEVHAALVAVFKHGEVIETVRTDELGCFAMPGVQPGRYSLVVTTPGEEAGSPDAGMDPDLLVSTAGKGGANAGFAALGIDVLPPERAPRLLDPLDEADGPTEDLEIDVALIDAHGVLQHVLMEASESTNSLGGGSSPSGASGVRTPCTSAPTTPAGSPPQSFVGTLNGPVGPLAFPVIDEDGSDNNPVCPSAP